MQGPCTDMTWLALYSAYMQYSGDGWQFITEYTGAYGDLSPEASLDANQDQLVVKRDRKSVV